MGCSRMAIEDSHQLLVSRSTQGWGIFAGTGGRHPVMTLQMTCIPNYKHDSLKDTIRLQQPIRCMSKPLCMAAMHGRHNTYQHHQVKDSILIAARFCNMSD